MFSAKISKAVLEKVGVVLKNTVRSYSEKNNSILFWKAPSGYISHSSILKPKNEVKAWVMSEKKNHPDFLWKRKILTDHQLKNMRKKYEKYQIMN